MTALDRLRHGARQGLWHVAFTAITGVTVVALTSRGASLTVAFTITAVGVFTLTVLVWGGFGDLLLHRVGRAITPTPLPWIFEGDRIVQVLDAGGEHGDWQHVETRTAWADVYRADEYPLPQPGPDTITGDPVTGNGPARQLLLAHTGAHVTVWWLDGEVPTITTGWVLGHDTTGGIDIGAEGEGDHIGMWSQITAVEIHPDPLWSASLACITGRDTDADTPIPHPSEVPVS